MGYTYQIGKYEVTNSQYAAFLNAKAATDTFELYNSEMDFSQFDGITQTGSLGSYTYAAKSGFENKPVNNVSFWNATRFANWLNNGQGGADTETGSYTLTSGGITENTVMRNHGANWVVASENEWYKAAFYDPTKDSVGGYWLHATRDATLGNNTDFSATNGANYNDGDYANGGRGFGSLRSSGLTRLPSTERVFVSFARYRSRDGENHAGCSEIERCRR